MPPSESPTFAAASTSAIIAASTVGSKQRTGESSTVVEVVGRGPLIGARPRRAHLDHVADDLRVELGEQQLRQRARGDARRGLARARPLQHVAGVVEAVLLHADEVGVARAAACATASR